MNILVTINDNYVKPLQVMLASLFKHETDALDIYLMYSSISAENINLLKSYIEKSGGRFIPVFVKDIMFEDAPVTYHYSKEMYYRLLCSELLPVILDRVLYLDPDMMIRGSIRSLYEVDFQENIIMGVYCRPMNSNEKFLQHKEELGLSEEDIYINSGVLLINLVQMRNFFSFKKILEMVGKKKDILLYPDQDMINVIFRGKIGVVDEIYNYPTFLTPFDFLRWILGGWMVEKPVIVHFQGPSKPWHIDYIGKYFFEYQKYYKELQSRRERIFFIWKHSVRYLLEMIKSFQRVSYRNLKKIKGAKDG